MGSDSGAGANFGPSWLANLRLGQGGMAFQLELPSKGA